MMPFFSRAGFKAAWNGYRPAPETSELRAMRKRTMGWNAAAALAVACVQLLSRLHPATVLLVVAIAVHAAAVTIRYWRTKNEADREFAARGPAGSAEGEVNP